ncbi:MAG: hypothetical protein H6850_01480 [Alphaproteobacteria bacterium]|nr:MAG: hypothetical protein H6850_01480 [Alphaproteobacteria bacterium]
MKSFIPSPAAKPKPTPTKISFKGELNLTTDPHLELTFEMRPEFDAKGRLLSLSFIHENLTHKHTFAIEDPLTENSPCGGVYSDTLPLSHIAQAYFKNDDRVIDITQNLLSGIESGAIQYGDLVSYRGYKKDAASKFVQICFKGRV